jgi:ribonucleoside-diphosphate reductase alpha chain
VPLEVFVKKFSYMRFDPEGITGNPEIPFAKSMPDYIMRWLASRFIDDVDELEELGILTAEVRARREAQQSMFLDDGAEQDTGERQDNGANGSREGNRSSGEAAAPAAGESLPPTSALTDAPPVVPAQLQGRDLGPACEQCGGMMQRTGSCYTCSSCGNNTGCG